MSLAGRTAAREKEDGRQREDKINPPGRTVTNERGRMAGRRRTSEPVGEDSGDREKHTPFEQIKRQPCLSPNRILTESENSYK